MTHELSESFDPQNPENALQAAAVDPKIGLLGFMAARSQAGRERAAERAGEPLEGYEVATPEDPHYEN